MRTIEEVASFLGVPREKTVKAVFYAADGQVVFVVIRGDLEVNEVKLRNELGAAELRLATEQEVAAKGLVAGYASPIGLSGVRVIADDSVLLGTNFVVGANKPDRHLKNANYPRDFRADVVTDIALARAGDPCPRCGRPLVLERGIEVGHTFKLGTVFSEKLEAVYLDREGELKPIYMGCYGIGLGRLLAAAVEQHHDERGIIWPVAIAPYQVYLCVLNVDNAEVSAAAEALYERLGRQGFEVLYDDREESAGVKFNDADLIGVPVRLVLSPRTLKQNGVEVKARADAEARLVGLEDLTGVLRGMLRSEDDGEAGGAQ